MVIRIVQGIPVRLAGMQLAYITFVSRPVARGGI